MRNAGKGVVEAFRKDGDTTAPDSNTAPASAPAPASE